MKTFILGVLGALALSGCAVGTSGDFQLDVEGGFTGEQVGAIQKAADQWEWATGGFIRFHRTGYAGDSTSIKVLGESMASIDQTFGRVGILGETVCQTQEWASTIWLSDDVDAETFLIMTKRELGHALGLPHAGPGTIMCAHRSCVSNDVTCDDVRALCSIWACDAEKMPACNPHIL